MMDDSIKKMILEEIEAELDEYDTEEDYRNFLNECNPVNLPGISCNYADLLESQDPTMYRTGRNDHIDSLDRNGRIISLDGGNTYYEIEKLQEWLDDNEFYHCGNCEEPITRDIPDQEKYFNILLGVKCISCGDFVSIENLDLQPLDIDDLKE